jgi:hypothetical protein
MSQATHRPSTDTSIDMDVNELITDADIAFSANPIEMVRKATSKINREILRLMFIQPRTEEITTRVDRLLLRSQCLSVSCVIFIYKIVHLHFLIIYPDMSWTNLCFVFTEFSAPTCSCRGACWHCRWQWFDNNVDWEVGDTSHHIQSEGGCGRCSTFY